MGKKAPEKPLTAQQRKFVDAYAACLSATKAAKLAGYSIGRANRAGYELLADPRIRSAINKAIRKQSRMPKDEIIARLERQASADISIFFKPGTFELDPVAFHENGDLVQLVMETKEGMRIRLHDSQKALELLGKKEALFVERTVLQDFEGMEIRDREGAGGKGAGRSGAAAASDAEED